MTHFVDVIVPVYKGFEQTERCLSSLLQNRQTTAHEIVVINDASPDPRIAALLMELAQQECITLIDHSDNRGFVFSINEAIALHPGRDVVLLNSDTAVAGDWLDRLSRCATSHPGTGTVTPFSNNATICSYPKFCRSNRQPTELSVAELDAIFRKTSAGAALEIPTGIGFCLYIRRACIDAVGDFNVDLFGLGYGEEVDFCMRASAVGYRHLLCANTYVFHVGSVSFGDSRNERIIQAQRIVDERYPEYPQLVRQHVQKDPARLVRRTVDLERLRIGSNPRVLMVTHAWGGGVQRHVDDLARLLADSAQVLVLKPYSDFVHVLAWAREEEEFSLYLNLHSDYRHLVDTMRQVGISRVHYHHVQGFPPSILNLPRDLAIPYWCTLHDYLPICPQYNLSDADGFYCGEPGLEECDRCLESRPAQWPWDIRHWRKEFSQFLYEADRVIVPTEDVAERIERYIPGIEPAIMGHPELHDSTSNEGGYFSSAYRKIAILGHITTQKGLANIADCAQDAYKNNLPISFRIIGTLGSPERINPNSPLSITGQYEETELNRLISQERPDAFFFASDVPETYSYTITTAKQTRLPIIAVQRGAFPERLADYSLAYIRSPDTSPSDWNRLFLSIPSAFPLATAYRGKDDETQATGHLDTYRASYREGLEIREPTEPLGSIPESFLYFPEEQRRPAPNIQQLFSDAFDRGLKESTDQLRRSIEEVEAKLEWQTQAIMERDRVISARDEQIRKQKRELLVRAQQFGTLTDEIEQLKQTLGAFERAHRKHVSELERTIKGLRKRIAELEGSQFWQMTYPLRMLIHRLKATAKQIQIARKTLPGRTKRVIDILKTQGPRGLIEEARKLGHRLEYRNEVASEGTPVRELLLDKEIHPLRMPRATDPVVSIVVPTYGQHQATFCCLDSIARHTNDIRIEVIVVDDYFAEPAAYALSCVENIEFVRNDTNLGFLRSCNRSLDFAKGKYIVFLNNDTLVREQWLTHLIAVFESFGDVGAVGAKLLFPDGKLQEAGGIVWRDASAWNYGRGQDPSAPSFNYVREVDYCSGACLLLPRQLFIDLGRFDERFAPAYYEDTDICFTVRAQGLRVMYQPEAEIIHFEGVSHGTDEGSGVKAYQARNKQLFADKWRLELNEHRENGVMPERERDRGVKNRILWVEACMLTPDQDSGSLRTSRLLRILRQTGSKVTFIADNLEYREPYVEQLQQAGVEVLYRPYVTSVESYLAKNAQQFDVIVLCRHYVAVKHIDSIRHTAPDTRIVFDTIDLHFLRLRRQAALDGKTQTKRLAKAAYQDELRVIQESDLTLVVSDVEKDILAQEAPEAEVLILSNVHDPVDTVTPLAERKDMMFVGGFQHPPNIDAIRYFAKDIWPHIRMTLPDVKVYVIGSKMPEELIVEGREAGLEMLGYVPDIEPYLRGCRLSISPLRYGAGVKGKVNQSMSYGLPVVATPASVEGMSLTHGQDILVADTADGFAKAILQLYADDELWERLSKRGLQNIRTQFSSDTARNALKEMFEKIGLPE